MFKFREMPTGNQ